MAAWTSFAVTPRDAAASRLKAMSSMGRPSVCSTLHILSTFRPTKHRSDLVGDIVHLSKSSPNTLIATSLRDAGDQFIEAHLDRLRHFVGMARNTG
jgi:hypothetical protein